MGSDLAGLAGMSVNLFLDANWASAVQVVVYTRRKQQKWVEILNPAGPPTREADGVLGDEMAVNPSTLQSDSDENTPEVIGSRRQTADGGLSPASVWLLLTGMHRRGSVGRDS